jgi:hypothetical protein
MYQINSRQKSIAQKLGVQIKPSTNANKKIDVYYRGKKIPIGARGYMDYHSYKKINLDLAFLKRKNYYARHKQNIVYPKAGYFAWKLLWN